MVKKLKEELYLQQNGNKIRDKYLNFKIARPSVLTIRNNNNTNA